MYCTQVLILCDVVCDGFIWNPSCLSHTTTVCDDMLDFFYTIIHVIIHVGAVCAVCAACRRSCSTHGTGSSTIPSCIETRL